MRNKKGLSAIVATLIIILLAIVAFGIISVVIKQTVTKGAESIKLGEKCLPLEIHAKKIVQATNDDGSNKTGSYNITLSRTAAGEDLDGVKIILTDEAEENTISDELLQVIKPLDLFTTQRTFTNFQQGFVPAKVTVVPFFVKDSGEKYLCDNPFTNELALE